MRTSLKQTRSGKIFASASTCQQTNRFFLFLVGPNASSTIIANAVNSERPGEDRGLFLGICGTPTACSTAAVGTVYGDGILNPMHAFT